MSYSYQDLKRLEAEQQKWVNKANEYRTLSNAAKEAGQELDTALQNLKNSLQRLTADVWSGPDAQACRGVIEQIHTEMTKQRSRLQQTVTIMTMREQEARTRAREVGEKLMYEVLPNLSMGGKVAATIDYYS